MSVFKSKLQSRRRFLSLGLVAGAGLATGNLAGQSEEESGKTVKMLSQDGKLVEVDRALLPPGSMKSYASKRDILRWIHTRE